MEAYQREFLQLAIAEKALKFGEFTLKSGRVSPYFFNAGEFHSGAALAALGRFYGAAIEASGVDYDLLFGPAYKGIPLASTTAVALADQGHSVPYCFNRKEAKTHGEGGSLVGAPLQGRALIIDDVITAGTAIREVMDILARHNAAAAGVVVGLDRMEKGRGEQSAIQEVEQEFGVPVISIVTIDHIIAFLREDSAAGGYIGQYYRLSRALRCKEWRIKRALMSKAAGEITAYKLLLPLLLAAGLLMVDISAAWAQDGGRYYRYRDAEGEFVISTSIPKEFAAKGYDILNSSFQLIRTVEPHRVLTDEEKAAKVQLQKQQEEDEYLLKSYSSASEIEAAMQRKLDSLSRDIALIEDNLKNTRLQRKQEERKAADAQRGGRAVSEAVIKMLNQLERRELDAQHAMEQRRTELEQVRKRFQHYINRYTQLTQ